MIYLDNHATTPVDSRVAAAMRPFWTRKFGNAASRTHLLGREAARAVETARRQVARLIHARPEEIVFTSGATESNNLALKGAAKAYRGRGNHIVTVATEHKSILDPCKRLSREGFKVTYLPVQKDGLLDLKVLRKAMGPRTILVSVMYANNEIGVIQPMREIGRLVRSKGALLVCDAVQAAGKIPVNVRTDRIDLLSLTAHKMYGPKGIGALYVRRSGHAVRLVPQIDGGGQERGFRSGTLNVPAIVGFGKACDIARREMAPEARRLLKLRGRLLVGLRGAIRGLRVNGSLKRRLPNNLNLQIPGVEASRLMEKLPGIALSTGSACLSTSPDPSHVLKAIGLTRDEARSSVRIGTGRYNTARQMDEARKQLARAVRRERDCPRHSELLK